MFEYFKQGDSRSRRTHKRYKMHVPFGVQGKDESGHFFVTKGFTRNISPDGGCLVIDKDIHHGERLKLIGPKGDLFFARVCWAVYEYLHDQRLVGFVLTSEKDRWVITNWRSPDSLGRF
jgi:hypothetical protein